MKQLFPLWIFLLLFLSDYNSTQAMESTKNLTSTNVQIFATEEVSIEETSKAERNIVSEQGIGKTENTNLVEKSTLTKTVVLPVGENTPIPEPSEVISLENVDQITQLACWGNASIEKLIYSKETNLLVSVNSCGTIAIYDADTLILKNSFHPDGQISGLEMMSDDKTIVIANFQGQYQFIDIPSCTIIRTLNGPNTDMFSLSVDGNWITVVNEDGITTISSKNGFSNNKLLYWDENYYRSEIIHSQFNSSGVSPSYSPDGKYLAFNKWGQLSLLSARNFSLIKSIDVSNAGNITFSRDGNFIYYTTHPDNNNWDKFVISRWDLINNQSKIIYQYSDCLEQYFSCNMTYSLSQDNKNLFVIEEKMVDKGRKGIVASYHFSQLDPVTGSIIKQIPVFSDSSENEDIMNLTENPGRHIIYFSSQSGRIYKFNYDEEKIEDFSVEEESLWDNWHHLNINPSLLLSTSKNNEFILRNLHDGSISKIIQPDKKYNSVLIHQNILVAIAADNSAVTGFNLDDGFPTFSISYPEEKFYYVDMSQDARIVALISDKQAGIWNTENGTKVTDIKYLPPHQYDIKLSPDGKTLASLGGDTYIKLWDTQTGILKRNLQYTSAMYEGINIDWSQDSKILVSTHGHGREIGFKVWNTETGALLYTLNYGGSVQNMEKYNINGESGPESIALSPDNNLVAIFDGIGAIFIFDYKNNKLVKQLDINGPRPKSSSFNLKFSEDGNYLFSLIQGNNGNNIQVWGVNPYKLSNTYSKGGSSTIATTSKNTLIFTPLPTLTLHPTDTRWPTATIVDTATPRPVNTPRPTDTRWPTLTQKP